MNFCNGIKDNVLEASKMLAECGDVTIVFERMYRQ